MEVVRVKKILAQNLLIYIGLHCVRRSSWTVTTLATLIDMGLYFYDYHDFQPKIRWAYTYATVYVIERTVGVIGKTTQVVLEGACTQF